jgi:hypothetical protein
VVRKAYNAPDIAKALADDRQAKHECQVVNRYSLEPQLYSQYEKPKSYAIAINNGYGEKAKKNCIESRANLRQSLLNISPMKGHVNAIIHEKKIPIKQKAHVLNTD